MVDQAHVDQALRKLSKKDDSGNAPDMPSLMFEQDSWDKVMKKFGGN
jgi:AP-1-like factor